MCGIVGYIGQRSAPEIILDGLRRLEYRGYDSAGLAVLGARGLEIRRRPGKIGGLEAALKADPVAGAVGLGHTRWATHGRPSEENAHPHADCNGSLVVVHNGIIENCWALKERLGAEGHRFRSETDTEVIAHLLEHHLRRGADLPAAVRAALHELKGAYAVAVLSAASPDLLVAAKQGAGAVVAGVGDGEAFVASDIPAILPYTREMTILEDGEMALITRAGVELLTLDGRAVERPPTRISWDAASAQKGGYPHFMLKEIYEQPEAVADTVAGRIVTGEGVVTLPEANLDRGLLRALRRAVLVACGTSYHAALIGRQMIERLAGLPAEVDIASEFRYRDAILGPDTLVIAISQSGETADTLGAAKVARLRGAPLLAITNVVGSALAREATGVLYTRAGPEIGVASTKTFTATLSACYLLGLALGRGRGTLTGVEVGKRVEDLADVPRLMRAALARARAVADLAGHLVDRPNALYLGRGVHFPVALEGALKLKELAYVHAEGHAGGEMTVPAAADLLGPLVTVVPVQLLAYHIAARRGLDADQPRNLAKSVTVE